MNQQVVEKLPSFDDRVGGKFRVVPHDQPDPFPWVESTGFTSPRHESEPQNPGQRCGKMKWYNDARGFGLTVCGAFVHIKNVVSGELREGVRIKFEIRDGAKGPEAVNVRVIG